MKKQKLILLLFIVMAINSNAQKFLESNIYGQKFQRIWPVILQGVPNDTVSLSSDLKSVHWIAAISETLYLWSPIQNKWIQIVGSGSGASQIQSDFGQTDASALDYIKNKPVAHVEEFPGTTSNQFTVQRTPFSSSIELYINGQRIARSYYTISVNTILINSSLIGFATDTNDKIEIKYLSTL